MWLASLGVGVLLVAIGLVITQKPRTATNHPGSPSQTINNGPATQQEKAEAEQHKAELEQKAAQEKAATPSPTTKKVVVPFVASWGQDPDNNSFELSAFISDVYEDGGTCTLTMSASGKTITKTSTGHKDVNKTTCTPFVVSRTELTAGDWTAAVQYTSASAQGISNQQAVTVR
jgi:hypothetical protein